MKILTKAPLFAKQRGDGGEFMCSGFRVKCLAYSVQFKTKRQRPQGARPQDSEALRQLPKGARLIRPVTTPCAFLHLPSPNLPLTPSNWSGRKTFLQFAIINEQLTIGNLCAFSSAGDYLRGSRL